CCRYFDLFLIPGYAGVMFQGSEPKGNLDIPWLAVFGKAGTEEPGAVINTASPFGIEGDVIAFQVFGHGAGKMDPLRQLLAKPLLRNALVFPIDGEAPIAFK